MSQPMITLREKIVQLAFEAICKDQTANQTADAILAAVIEHATSDEAVERARSLWVKHPGPTNAAWKVAIRAAIEESLSSI